MSNPLLAHHELPDFRLIRPEHVEPAMRAQLDENRRRLQALLVSGAHTFAQLVDPVEEMAHHLGRTWSPVSHLNSVMNSRALREAYTAALPLLTEYQTELGQNELLYRRYAHIAKTEGSLDSTQRHLLRNALRDFELAGVALDTRRKQRYKELMQELAQQQAKFQENVLDSAAAWSCHVIDPSKLEGMPQTALHRARALARNQQVEGWLLTLDQPTYTAVMSHVSNRELRKELYTAWNTRASDQGPTAGQWDNAPLLEDILARRHELACLLGFPHYTGLSLATKMARSDEEVRSFLEDLAARCVPMARRELEELEQFAGQSLQPWDVAYYSERLLRERFDLSEEELRPYFPLPHVLAGLLEVTSRLYGVQFREQAQAAVWHPEVRYFEMWRDGKLAGGFYLDAYARPDKRSGAWMDDCIGRLDANGARALPVAYLTCNFLPPVDSQPALLTHCDVITLFHEFGHGLHHLLTRIGYPSVAGINGVPWDAVELPSQFMENYAWSEHVLRLISAHVLTGEPLPREKIDRLHRLRTFQAGLAAVRQLEFALFDLRIHTEYDPSRGSRWSEILDEVRRRVAIVPVPHFVRFPHSFGHVFGGGYAAGYYSYKWAEVLAADAFAAFEEKGLFDTATARRFLDCILSSGGACDAMEAFVAFRGRAPDAKPLLRQMGAS